MTQSSETIEYRVATENDWDAIWSVLEEAGPEIPISFDTQEKQAKMRAVIAERTASGYSWIAAKADGTVVGVALARPDVYGKQRALYLDYIVVDPGSRKRKICATLVGKLKARNIVITADVLSGNLSSMTNILTNFGFAKIESDNNKTKLKWSPPTAENAEKKQ